MLWGLWGIVTGMSVLALVGGLRGLLRLRMVPEDPRGELEPIIVEWGQPTVEIPTIGSAQYLALPGPPPPSFAELAGPQQPAPAVADQQAPAASRPVVDWSDKQVAVEIIESVRAPSITDFTPLPIPLVDELGAWEPGDAELVPALILNTLLNEREDMS